MYNYVFYSDPWALCLIDMHVRNCCCFRLLQVIAFGKQLYQNLFVVFFVSVKADGQTITVWVKWS